MNLLALFAYDSYRKLIVLSFRGSVCGSHGANAKIDFEHKLVSFKDSNIGGKCDDKAGCRVHVGFKDAYERLQG
jgi:hypothetical protein